MEKLEIGTKANQLAIEYNVTESAISQMKKRKNDILAAVSNTDHQVKNKTLHKSEFSEVEQKMYEWFKKQRHRKCPVNRFISKTKAKEIFGIDRCKLK